jgi:hypothetical protein
MEKVYNQPKGEFVIGFIDEFEMASYKGINPISITFRPSAVMQPYEALEYANEFSDYIVKEAKMILAEHNEFYKHWEIRFSNQFTGTAATRHNVNSDLLATGRVTMNVYCKKSF